MRNYKIKMLRQDKPFVVIGSNVEVSDGVLLVVEPVKNPNNVVVGTRVCFRCARRTKSTTSTALLEAPPVFLDTD